MDSINQDGELISFVGNLNAKHFEKSPIWYQYYNPDEIEEMERDGYSSKKLFEFLVKPLENNDSHPYYTVLDKFYLNREFWYVKCQINISSYFMDGYLVMIDNSISCLSVFTEDTSLELYSNNVDLDEYNKEFFILLSEHLKVKIPYIDKVNFKIDHSLYDLFKLDGIFIIGKDNCLSGASL